jgi:hypothetical protein
LDRNADAESARENAFEFSLRTGHEAAARTPLQQRHWPKKKAVGVTREAETLWSAFSALF